LPARFETWNPVCEWLLCACTDIFPLSVSDKKNYRLIASTDKKTGIHARIIWCCSWTHDSKYFITGSRDGKVAVWGHKGATSETISPLGQYALSSKPLEFPDQSVTALAVAPMNIAPDVYLVAVGLESGCINMCKWSPVSSETADNWQRCLELDNSYPSFNVVVFYPVYTDFLLPSLPLLYELSSNKAP
jgi:elongator complex protein 2